MVRFEHASMDHFPNVINVLNIRIFLRLNHWSSKSFQIYCLKKFANNLKVLIFLSLTCLWAGYQVKSGGNFFMDFLLGVLTAVLHLKKNCKKSHYYAQVVCQPVGFSLLDFSHGMGNFRMNKRGSRSWRKRWCVVPLDKFLLLWLRDCGYPISLSNSQRLRICALLSRPPM